MHIIRYSNGELHSKAVAALRVMADADFDAGTRYLQVNQQQLEDLAELGRIPPDELQRLRQSGALPSSNGEASGYAGLDPASSNDASGFPLARE